MNITKFILISLALMTSSAFAVIDPGPDGIGIYFDNDANNWQIQVGPSTPFYAYVILTNPTAAEIQSYEFSYRFNVPPAMESMFFRLAMVFPGNVLIDPTLPNYDLFADEVAVQTGVPLPGSTTVVLLTWQFMLLAQMEIDIYLDPTSGEAPTTGRLAYESESGWVDMDPLIGNILGYVATINRDWVSPVTTTTFGSLKALYR